MMKFDAIIIPNACCDELFNKYLEVRRRVFVEEQGVDISIEIDEYEKCGDTLHLVVIAPSGAAAGAGRLVHCGFHGPRDGDNAGGAGAKPFKTAKIGRVCVLKEFRGQGIGKLIVEKLIEAARARGYEEIILHSQVYIAALYEKFGFKKRGEVFKEAGIDHIEMTADI
jgi:predicted GNAT family N-acyltransferase